METCVLSLKMSKKLPWAPAFTENPPFRSPQLSTSADPDSSPFVSTLPVTPASSPRSSVADASRSRKIVASAILANDIPKLSYVKLDVSLIIPWRVVEAAYGGDKVCFKCCVRGNTGAHGQL